MERHQWVLSRTGMCVLTMNMTYWTINAEKALNEEGAEGVRKYAVRCTELLNDIVNLVRSNISPLDRCTIEALIVLDVHNRDVVEQLAEMKIEKMNDF